MKSTTSRVGNQQRSPGGRVILAVVALVLAAGMVWLLLAVIKDSPLSSLFGSTSNRGLQPALFQTAPLRTAQGGVDRVYVVSTQSQTEIFRSARSVTETRTDTLHVDLWAVDAATATVAWRKRLRTFKNKELEGRILPGFAILGADGETLWVNVEGPLGVSLADGHAVADLALIAQRNPVIAGKILIAPGYVAFGRNGLQLTLDNASQWRIDARNLSAALRETPVSEPAGIVVPADFRRGGTRRLQMRSLKIGQSWLGVLTDAEAVELSHAPVIPGGDPDQRAGAIQQYLNENHVPKPLNEPLPQPYRLWKAQVNEVPAAPPDWSSELPNNWGTREEFGHYEVLPDSPTFLRAGLLREHASAKFPLWYRDPDSVLVLHLDRLGPAGRLQLTRASGPLGKSVWQIALPMDALEAVMRGERDIVLLGSELEGVIERRKLARIDVESGRSIVLDLSAASMTTPADAEE